MTNTSILSKLKGSFVLMIFGLLFIIGAVMLTWWNEGRTIKNHIGLTQGSSEVYSSQNIDYVSPENEGKLIHISGLVKSDELLADEDFGISTPSLKFKREVEMYQWKENKESKSQEGTDEKLDVYTYDKVWSSSLNQSEKFNQPDGHQNPIEFKYQSFRKKVGRATLGAHDLNSSQIDRLSNWSDFNFNEINELSDASLINLEGMQSTIYVGTNSLQNPTIGDYKITYKSVEQSDYSLIAQQSQNSFQPFVSKKGTHIDLLSPGIKSAENMFESAISQNNFIKWLLRLGGFLAMFIGIRMLFKPLTTLTDYIPIVKTLVNLGVGLIAGAVAFVIWTITAGIAWVFYRPILGFCLLGLGIGVLIYIRSKMKQSGG